ncbi:inactive transglutaminase family protein [Marinobacteraceae bacterium S3BR75-40.1]
MNSVSVKLWALLLAALGLGICAYKSYELGLPLKPQKDAEIWTVQAKASFKGEGGPAKFSLYVPDDTPGFMKLDEDFISSRFGLTVDEEGQNREANWAVRRARGEQTLYYRLTISDADRDPEWGPKPAFPKKPEYPEPDASAIHAILEDVRSESADVASFTSELLLQLNAPKANENVDLIRDRASSRSEWTGEIIDVLAGVRIPARRIWGLPVHDDANDLHLIAYLQVHNGSEWLTFDPETGARGLPDDFLVWKFGEGPLYRLSGGHNLKVTFSATRTYAELIDVARRGAEQMDSFFARFSLFSLPVQNQNVYRLILMVPLGALLVVILRTLVGVHTFGTFMPILIALAFRETQLFWGVILFSTVVAIGLVIRLFLEKMMLLLVPRLAAILVVVVMLMVLISLSTQELGIDRLLSIALFPMVIMAMTIERMSIVWEESGFYDALMQGVGSILVACAGYLVMTNEHLMYLIFVFPELLLVVLGACLWMGRYTGYRLSELFRFGAMVVDQNGKRGGR